MNPNIDFFMGLEEEKRLNEKKLRELDMRNQRKLKAKLNTQTTNDEVQIQSKEQAEKLQEYFENI